MAAQWFLPGYGQIHEDSEDEWFVPGYGQINEDAAAADNVTVANISAALSTSAGGSTNFTKTGFGTPKACRIVISFDAVDDTGVAVQSKVSIGFSDFTNNFCITHQDEDASAKVDSDCRKSNTKAYVVLDADGNVLFSGTATTTTDGVTLTHTAGEAPSSAFFASVTMYGGDDLAVSLVRTTINATQNGTATIAHSGFTDGNDKLIFFIGLDLATEDSSGTAVNNSFGVCHATGSDAGGWTLTQRAMGWTSDHNNARGSPSSIISTDRVLDILTEAGGQDWGLEVTALDHSPAEWTVTTRDVGAGAGMEVYSLALDLDDRKAKVGSVDSPTGSTFSVTGMGFKPQYVGMLLTDLDAEDVIETADVQAGVHGISSNTGPGEETCHSWYNAEDTAAADTANLFRSRVIDLRDDDTSQTLQDHSHSSFDSGGVTHTVNSEDETVAKKWGFWAIEEAGGGAVLIAVAGAFTLGGVASNLLWKHQMTAALGTFALGGVASVTTKDTPMTAALGTFTLAGPTANLLWNHIVTAALGTFALAGIAADTRVGFTMPADAGAFSLGGVAANLLVGHLLDAALGTFTLTGIAAITSRDVFMAADLGTFALTGPAANTLVGHLISADQGTFTLGGVAANILLDLVMVADQGTFTLTGIAAITTVGAANVMLANQGNFLLTGNAAITTDSGGALGTLILPIGGRRRRSR